MRCSEIPSIWFHHLVAVCLLQGGSSFQHPYTYLLFLGADGQGNMLPARQLRDKYCVSRRDVYAPGAPPPRCRSSGVVVVVAVPRTSGKVNGVLCAAAG